MDNKVYSLSNMHYLIAVHVDDPQPGILHAYRLADVVIVLADTATPARSPQK
jgi:hypothetical protein